MQPSQNGSLEDGNGSSSGASKPSGRRTGAVGATAARLRKLLSNPANMRALAYGLMNVLSASGIVFANKAVFSTHGYHFTYALTWIHTAFTLAGMQLFVRSGLFPAKQLPTLSVTPLAAAFVAYIVLCNLSLKVNTVGFYQVGASEQLGVCVAVGAGTFMCTCMHVLACLDWQRLAAGFMLLYGQGAGDSRRVLPEAC